MSLEERTHQRVEQYAQEPRISGNYSLAKWGDDLKISDQFLQAQTLKSQPIAMSGQKWQELHYPDQCLKIFEALEFERQANPPMLIPGSESRPLAFLCQGILFEEILNIFWIIIYRRVSFYPNDFTGRRIDSDPFKESLPSLRDRIAPFGFRARESKSSSHHFIWNLNDRHAYETNKERDQNIRSNLYFCDETMTDGWTDREESIQKNILSETIESCLIDGKYRLENKPFLVTDPLRMCIYFYESRESFMSQQKCIFSMDLYGCDHEWHQTCIETHSSGEKPGMVEIKLILSGLDNSTLIFLVKSESARRIFESLAIIVAPHLALLSIHLNRIYESIHMNVPKMIDWIWDFEWIGQILREFIEKMNETQESMDVKKIYSDQFFKCPKESNGVFLRMILADHFSNKMTCNDAKKWKIEQILKLLTREYAQIRWRLADLGSQIHSYDLESRRMKLIHPCTLSKIQAKGWEHDSGKKDLKLNLNEMEFSPLVGLGQYPGWREIQDVVKLIGQRISCHLIAFSIKEKKKEMVHFDTSGDKLSLLVDPGTFKMTVNQSEETVFALNCTGLRGKITMTGKDIEIRPFFVSSDNSLKISLTVAEPGPLFDALSLLFDPHLALLSHYLDTIYETVCTLLHDCASWLSDLKFITGVMGKIMAYPARSKYRQINLQVIREKRKLKKMPEAVQVFKAAGWFEKADSERIQFPDSLISRVDDLVNVLTREYERTMAQSVSMWVQINPTKINYRTQSDTVSNELKKSGWKMNESKNQLRLNLNDLPIHRKHNETWEYAILQFHQPNQKWHVIKHIEGVTNRPRGIQVDSFTIQMADAIILFMDNPFLQIDPIKMKVSLFQESKCKEKLFEMSFYGDQSIDNSVLTQPFNGGRSRYFLVTIPNRSKVIQFQSPDSLEAIKVRELLSLCLCQVVSHFEDRPNECRLDFKGSAMNHRDDSKCATFRVNRRVDIPEFMVHNDIDLYKTHLPLDSIKSHEMTFGAPPDNRLFSPPHVTIVNDELIQSSIDIRQKKMFAYRHIFAQNEVVVNMDLKMIVHGFIRNGTIKLVPGLLSEDIRRNENLDEIERIFNYVENDPASLTETESDLVILKQVKKKWNCKTHHRLGYPLSMGHILALILHSNFDDDTIIFYDRSDPSFLEIHLNRAIEILSHLQDFPESIEYLYAVVPREVIRDDQPFFQFQSVISATDDLKKVIQGKSDDDDAGVIVRFGKEFFSDPDIFKCDVCWLAKKSSERRYLFANRQPTEKGEVFRMSKVENDFNRVMVHVTR